MLKGEQGNLILMTIIILAVVSILGISLVTLASLENLMVVNVNKNKQAYLAADAGIEIARDIIINKLKTNTPIDKIKEDIMENFQNELEIGENLTTKIIALDIDKYNSDEEIEITALGRYLDNEKKVAAILKFTNLPINPIKTNNFKAAGRYNEKIDYNNTYFIEEEEGWVIKSYYEPWGKVITSDGDILYKNIVTNEPDSKYFNTELAEIAIAQMTPLTPKNEPNPDRPPHLLNSQDFLNTGYESEFCLPSLSKSDVAYFYQIALLDKDNWDIWDEKYKKGNKGKFSLDKVEKPYNYIVSDLDDISVNDIPSKKNINITIKNEFRQKFLNWQHFFLGIKTPAVTYAPDDEKVLLIVTNDNLHLEIENQLDSMLLDLSAITLYLLSSGNINFTHSYNSLNQANTSTEQKLKVYALAGQSLALDSNINNLIINGSLQSPKDLTIDIDDSVLIKDEVNDLEDFIVNISTKNNYTLVDNFPFRWSFLGIGRIIDYRQGVEE
ncbi:MAG: hypothetical protein GX333_06785 [Syntrophomonadaceae bacterium]|nr:hypothetical protein [Syntrophomonadaceae bacterium]